MIASKMNMNNLLNEENEGYSWEGDYEKTWYIKHNFNIILTLHSKVCLL